MKKITTIKYEKLINFLHDAETPDNFQDNIIVTSELNNQLNEHSETYISPIYE